MEVVHFIYQSNYVVGVSVKKLGENRVGLLKKILYID